MEETPLTFTDSASDEKPPHRVITVSSDKVGVVELVEQPPAPSVKRGLYDFLPTQEDPYPLTFPRTPVQEISLDYFKPDFCIHGTSSNFF